MEHCRAIPIHQTRLRKVWRRRTPLITLQSPVLRTRHLCYPRWHACQQEAGFPLPRCHRTLQQPKLRRPQCAPHRKPICRSPSSSPSGITDGCLRKYASHLCMEIEDLLTPAHVKRTSTGFQQVRPAEEGQCNVEGPLTATTEPRPRTVCRLAIR